MHVSKGQPIANDETVIVNPNTESLFQPLGNSNPDLGATRRRTRGRSSGPGWRRCHKALPSFAYHAANAPVRALTTLPMVGLGEAGWRNMVRRTRTSVRAAGEFPDEFAEESEAAAPRTREARAVRIRIVSRSDCQGRAAIPLSKARLTSCGAAIHAAAAGSPECSSGWRAA